MGPQTPTSGIPLRGDSDDNDRTNESDTTLTTTTTAAAVAALATLLCEGVVVNVAMGYTAHRCVRVHNVYV